MKIKISKESLDCMFNQLCVYQSFTRDVILKNVRSVSIQGNNFIKTYRT